MFLIIVIWYPEQRRKAKGPSTCELGRSQLLTDGPFLFQVTPQAFQYSKKVKHADLQSTWGVRCPEFFPMSLISSAQASVFL